MTTTSSDLTLLRRAVLLDPGSDDARLVFADALQEHGGEIEAKWSELIRVGCELRYHPTHHTAETGCPHRKREDALIRDLTTWLRRGERCTSCGGRRIVRQAVLKPFKFTIEPPRIEPSASLFELSTVEVECPTCHGAGWLGSLADIPEDRITISRGFVGRVELAADQVQDTGFMARLFSEWPVTEAGLIGKEPHEDGGHNIGPNYRTLTHDWWRNSDDAVCDLPDTLFDEVSKRGWRYDYDNGSSVCEFTTAAYAVAALSRAIVSLGREAVGLPQLEEVRT